MLRAEFKQSNLVSGSRVNGHRESLELAPQGESPLCQEGTEMVWTTSLVQEKLLH